MITSIIIIFFFTFCIEITVDERSRSWTIRTIFMGLLNDFPASLIAGEVPFLIRRIGLLSSFGCRGLVWLLGSRFSQSLVAKLVHRLNAVHDIFPRHSSATVRKDSPGTRSVPTNICGVDIVWIQQPALGSWMGCPGRSRIVCRSYP